MAKFTAAANYAVKHSDRGDFLHSSGYAKTQSGANFGAASAESFAARRAIEEHRKFIKGYRNSKITNSFYGVQRAKVYRSETGEKASGLGHENPMDRAISRAKFSASGDRGRQSVSAKAPQVPNRRAGI